MSTPIPPEPTAYPSSWRPKGIPEPEPEPTPTDAVALFLGSLPDEQYLALIHQVADARNARREASL